MRQWIILATLTATAWGLTGCGGAEPPKNPEASTPKVPDVPKGGP